MLRPCKLLAKQAANCYAGAQSFRRLPIWWARLDVFPACCSLSAASCLPLSIWAQGHSCGHCPCGISAPQRLPMLRVPVRWLKRTDCCHAAPAPASTRQSNPDDPNPWSTACTIEAAAPMLDTEQKDDLSTEPARQTEESAHISPRVLLLLHAMAVRNLLATRLGTQGNVVLLLLVVQGAGGSGLTALRRASAAVSLSEISLFLNQTLSPAQSLHARRSLDQRKRSAPESWQVTLFREGFHGYSSLPPYARGAHISSHHLYHPAHSMCDASVYIQGDLSCHLPEEQVS